MIRSFALILMSVVLTLATLPVIAVVAWPSVKDEARALLLAFLFDDGLAIPGDLRRALDGADGGDAPSQAQETLDENGALIANERAFFWDEFPEFAEVLRPANRVEFLTPHASDRGYGDPQAPVVMIDFFSYQCPDCAAFHEGPFQQIMEEYVETGLAYFIKRDFLLNDQEVGFELNAGAGAQCFIDPAGARLFADLVFRQQNALASAPNPFESLVTVFTDAGMEAGMARTCMRDHRNRSLVLLRSKRAKDAAQVSSAPTLFINQERYTGSILDFNAIRTEVERALIRVGS